MHIIKPSSDDTVEIVRKRLEEARKDRVYLKVSNHKVDDDWLYIVVEPEKAGVRASDHANLMSKIEQELRAMGVEKVLLVPALDD